MDKTIKKTTDWVMGIVAFIVALGIGGLFIAGTFQSVVILSILPAIVHTVVGWAMIAGTVLTAVFKIIK